MPLNSGAGVSNGSKEEKCFRRSGRIAGWLDGRAAEQQGLDPDLICAIGPRFEAWHEANAHAVLVARHGALVYEHYFTGEDEGLGRPLGCVVFDASVRHDLRSITKSVTGLLVSIALDRGWIKDVDTPVFSYFPEYADLRTPHVCRRKIQMSPGVQSRDDTPVGGRDDQRDTASEPNAGWGLSDYCR